MSGLPASRWGRFALEVRIFIDHTVVLWLPGSKLRAVEAHPGGAGTPEGWNEAELQMLIDEGRRQLDRQRADLEQIRARAQFLFTSALALLVVLAAGLQTVRAQDSWVLAAAWATGMVSVGAGLLATGGIITGRAELGIVDAALLSAESPPIDVALAGAYAEFVRPGENTVATKLTVLRDSVLVVLVGGAIAAVIWYLAV